VVIKTKIAFIGGIKSFAAAAAAAGWRLSAASATHSRTTRRTVVRSEGETGNRGGRKIRDGRNARGDMKMHFVHRKIVVGGAGQTNNQTILLLGPLLLEMLHDEIFHFEMGKIS